MSLKAPIKNLRSFPIGGRLFDFARRTFRALPLPLRLKDYLRFWVVNRSGLFKAVKRNSNYFGESEVIDPSKAGQSASVKGLRKRVDDFLTDREKSWVPRTEKLINLDNQNLSEVATGIIFQVEQSPVVSIIIPAFENIQLTLECLASLQRSPGNTEFQVIVADDGSTNDSVQILKLIRGIDLVCNPSNLGFLRNCNGALPQVRGKYILYLNNDVQVTAGAVDALVKSFSTEFKIGAVGPKIIFPFGHLQEAGVSLRFDGSTEMVGLNKNPNDPEFNFTRAVDYCSGACLMVPTALVKEIGGFSDEFAPAYYEDADLCLKLLKLGYKTYYNPAAKVVHHLSRTTAIDGDADKTLQVLTNRCKFQAKWKRELDELSSVKIIAFYLPQFHAIAENDAWWGQGFTEWTNVRKAKPNFEGHDQPKIPADLGYYDLNSADVMQSQFDLAAKYGVDGFCFYYYWFGGKRLLEMPVDRLLDPASPKFPYLLCWANENWSRRWDGQENEILISQNHSKQDDIAVIEDLIQHFKNPSYIRIDGRPHLIVYRVDLFPNFVETARRWREHCRRCGIGEIYLTMVESHDLVHKNVPSSEFGCDASIEFPPLNMGNHVEPPGAMLNKSFVGGIGDYSEAAFRYCTRPLPKFNRFRGVMPGWDNTARRQDNSFCFVDSSPQLFQEWLEFTIKQTRSQKHGDEKIVFINAWNEWAEGAYLEPDTKYGHQFLEAVRNARDAARLLGRG